MYSRFSSIALFLGLAFLSACSSNKNNSDDRFAGNRQMAALLDSINKHADPMTNYYLSELRAQRMLKSKPEKFETLDKKLEWTRGYCFELISSGKFEDAAKILNTTLEEFPGGIDKAITNKSYKIIYDLLAVNYLRMGEQQNCVANHNGASCIVPLKPQAWHTIKTGSQKAIEIYTLILNQYPDDYQARWLLNIAHMTLGAYPDGIPEKWRIPVSAFDASKANFPPFEDIAIPLGVELMSLAGGAIMEDFNNDGFLDLFCTSYGLFDNVKLFMSKGDGTFEDATDKSQLTGITGGLNTVQADFNNDGFVDILILRGAWLDKGGEAPNSFLRNNGDGTFSDITIKAGLLTFCPTETACLADFNNDGFIDIYVANENNKENHYPCEFWVNNGNETFTNMAKTFGLDGNFGWVKACIWKDFNNDGRPDLMIAPISGENMLFMNRGGTSTKDWKFENISDKANIKLPISSFPSLVFDYNNDGFQDIYIAGFDLKRLDKVGEDVALEYLGLPAKAEKPHMYRNNGDETFTDVTHELGLDKVTYAMGCNFGDIDNDGWLDIYAGTGAFDFTSLQPNRMFKNIDGKRFEEVSMNGFAHLQKGHGIAFGDLDNDGDQDIYCTMGGAYDGDRANNVLFHNPGEPGNWVTVSLEGKTVNKLGIGSRIKVNVLNKDDSKRSIYVYVSSGGSFGAASLQQEIGLGKNAKSIESIEVGWEKPGLPVTLYKGINMGTFVLLKEGTDKPTLVNRKKINLKTSGGAHHHHGS